MKLIHYFFTTASVVILLFVAFSFVNKKAEIPEKHVEVVLRDIGHHLLLFAKDSTSRVLPIRKIRDNTYQISFENSFKFVPDSLISLVNYHISKNKLPQQHFVSVKNCRNFEVIYAYEKTSFIDGVLACKGRDQDAGCYVIEIEFVKENYSHYLLLLLAPIALIILSFFLKKWLQKTEPAETEPADIETKNLNFLKIGKFEFYPEKNVLKIGQEAITLSERETKLLKIFAENPDQVLERDRLTKEVWEDEGILVMSRNLDVFVSKLRKKLIEDEAVKINNVHGKGYKLVVD